MNNSKLSSINNIHLESTIQTNKGKTLLIGSLLSFLDLLRNLTVSVVLLSLFSIIGIQHQNIDETLFLRHTYKQTIRTGVGGRGWSY